MANDEEPQRMHVDVLLDEYRALYALLLLRTESMEKRIPLTGSALYAVLGSVPLLEPLSRTLVLLMLPAAAVWLLRTTISHARAKQDVKIRLVQVEQHINDLVNAELLGFQSRHPSAGGAVAGRTGHDAIRAVYAGTLVLLLACGFVALSLGTTTVMPTSVYFGILGVAAAVLTWDVLCIRRYRRLEPSRPTP